MEAAMYHVYVFLDGKNRPYYVGKTNNMERRREEHLKEIKSGNPLPKYNRARDLYKKGVKFNMKSIRTAVSEDRSYKLERYYIKKFRDDGYILMNCTHGGPDEKPLRINKPLNERKTGLKLPLVIKKKTEIKVKVKKKDKPKRKGKRK